MQAVHQQMEWQVAVNCFSAISTPSACCLCVDGKGGFTNVQSTALDSKAPGISMLVVPIMSCVNRVLPALRLLDAEASKRVQVLRL